MPHVASPPARSPAPAPPTAPAGDGGPEPILGRVLLLLALVAVLDLWMVRHVGVGIRNVSAVVIVGGAVTGAAKLLKAVFPAELEALAALVRRLLRVLAHPTVLVAGSVLVVAVLLTVSSVVVVPEDGGGDPHVRIIPLDDPGAVRTPSLPGGARLIRAALVPTTPFGRTVRVEADGYVAGLFELYPITGLRLRLGTQLAPSPSILVRPGVDVLGALADGASLRVWRLTDTGREPIAGDSGRAAAFMIGRRRTIPAGHRDEWRRELTQQGAPEPVAADIMGRWQDPVPLAPDRPLAPGTRLLIAVGFAPDDPVASVEITLDATPLVDVPLFAPDR